MTEWQSSSVIARFNLISQDYQQAREEFGKIASKIASEANKGEKNPVFGKHWINNPQTKEFKMISSDEQLPIGWEYGKYQPITDKVKKQLKIFAQSSKGKIRIYNPTTNKLKWIHKGDPIPKGFEKRGRPLQEQDKQKIRDFFEAGNH